MNILNKDILNIILGILEREPSDLEYVCCKYLYQLCKQRKERYLKEFSSYDKEFNNRPLIRQLRKEKKLDLYSIKKYKEILYIHILDYNRLKYDLLIDISDINVLDVLKHLKVTTIDELLKLPLETFANILKSESFVDDIELIQSQLDHIPHPNLVALLFTIYQGDLVNTIMDFQHY
jgi:hypothetical protein